MTGVFFILYPLQIKATDFKWVDKSPTDNVLQVGLLIAVVVIAIIFLINARRGVKFNFSIGSKASKAFSGFALRRMVKNAGLSRGQIKMLDFVFKTDEVTDPEKSLNNPTLLDRHFRRAFRVIEQSANIDAETQNKLSVLFSTRNILENSVIGAMTSTRQLPDDTTLTITYGKDKIKANVLNAKVENITIEAPKNVLGSQIKIPRGTRLDVLFFTKSNKCFSFETRVVGYSTMRGHPALLLAHSSQIRFLSQRRFRRRQAVIACILYLVYVEGSGKKQRLVVDKRRLSGNIADISVGGCSIKTTAQVQVGVRFKVEFAQGDVNVAALGQVLRTNKTGINTVIHLKFLRVSQKSMNIINSFVYEYAHE